MNNWIRHLVVSGCSQTADGIGGLPLTEKHPGGCSYVDQGDGSGAEPNSWVGFVAKDLHVQSMVNLASGGRGNYYVAYTLIDFLSRNPYPVDNTLVLFNLSQPERIDIPCAFDHPDSCLHVLHPRTIISHSWINAGSHLHKNLIKNIGFEQIFCQSRVAVLSLLSFLKCQGYRYKFICMRDYTQDPYMANIINHDTNRIDLWPGKGIVEFATAIDELKDPVHPTVRGHRLISEQVLRCL
jgi:hypothetical protein